MVDYVERAGLHLADQMFWMPMELRRIVPGAQLDVVAARNGKKSHNLAEVPNSFASLPSYASFSTELKRVRRTKQHYVSHVIAFFFRTAFYIVRHCLTLSCLGGRRASPVAP